MVSMGDEVELEDVWSAVQALSDGGAGADFDQLQGELVRLSLSTTISLSLSSLSLSLSLSLFCLDPPWTIAP
jgi:hypothetical protein